VKASRLLVALVALYVVLDLSLPAMPGAFVFDVDDSVESARAGRDRNAASGASARAPVPPSTALVRTPVVVPARIVPSRRPHRLARGAVPALALADPLSSPEDPHEPPPPPSVVGSTSTDPRGGSHETGIRGNRRGRHHARHHPARHRAGQVRLLSPSPEVEEADMTKVGRFVTDPRVGSYCQMTLDSGEKVLVSHEHARLTVEISRFFGFSSDRIFACDLDTPEGRALLARLTRAAEPGSADATPLGALVKSLTDCGSAAEVRARCAALGSPS
jgi:hypothetical protein